MMARPNLPLPRTAIPVALGLLLASCATFQDEGSKPQAQQQSGRVTAVDFHGSQIEFTWQFSNPLGREIRLVSHVWELEIQGKRVARGQSRQVRRIGPHSELTLPLTVQLRRADLEKTLGTTSLPYELPYRFRGRAHLGVSVQTWSFDFEEQGRVQLLVAPQFDVPTIHILSMDDSRARISLQIHISNTNAFPTTLEDFRANLILAGQTIAQDVAAPVAAIEPNATTLVPLTLELNFARLGRVVRRALSQSQSLYTIYGRTTLTTPWGPKQLNYDHSGTVRIQTSTPSAVITP